ncbi:Hypothetical predicted protein [Octopus vulgaris]|uniref:Uncharacterized protein n=1 Tax=Octopus vulgaris TaxID=6645 RepID=A0AA36F8I7_OCTVU|nr:Hypothetical predicted protein [Octopus vulgaris]
MTYKHGTLNGECEESGQECEIEIMVRGNLWFGKLVMESKSLHRSLIPKRNESSAKPKQLYGKCLPLSDSIVMDSLGSRIFGSVSAVGGSLDALSYNCKSSFRDCNENCDGCTAAGDVAGKE